MVQTNYITKSLVKKEYLVAEAEIGSSLIQFARVLERTANKTGQLYASQANNNILLAVPGNSTGVLSEALSAALKDRTSHHHIVSNEGGDAIVIPIIKSDYERLKPPNTLDFTI